jgi:hypothetical protein
LFNIPTLGYSATSPSLSDNGKFPYFGRTCVSDSVQAIAAAQLVKVRGRRGGGGEGDQNPPPDWFFTEPNPFVIFLSHPPNQPLQRELKWDSIYVIGEIGSYSEFGVAEFVQAANAEDLRIVGKSTIQSQSTEAAREVVAELANSGASIVFLFVQADTGGMFLREAASQGIFGGESGFVYVVGDSMAGNSDSMISSLTTHSAECLGIGGEKE